MHFSRSRTRPAEIRGRTGFTLVEMLVVIIIITILAGLLLTGLRFARIRALNARVSIEVQQLSNAIESYKEKYGDYPPDFSNKAVVARHIRTAWPRISSAEIAAVWPVFWVNPNDDTDHESYVDPAEALVFWLGGMSSDATRPFTGTGGPFSGAGERVNPMFDFEEKRLTRILFDPGTGIQPWSNDEQRVHGRPAGDNDPFPIYYPKGRSASEPFVYFDSRTYRGGGGAPPPQYPPAPYAATRVQGVARPYRSDVPRVPDATDPIPFAWINDDTYQLLSAGLDGHYGNDHLQKQYPTGANYLTSPGDMDNVANFSDGDTFRDRLP